jgi:hypothetical protein
VPFNIIKKRLRFWQALGIDSAKPLILQNTSAHPGGDSHQDGRIS